MIRLVVVTLFVTMLSGCLVTRQEVRDKTTVSPEQQQRANSEMRYREVEEQNRQLMGRLEALENQIQRMNTEKSGTQAEQAAEKRALEEKLRIYEEAIGKVETQNLLLAQKVETLQAALTEKSRSSAKGTSSSDKNTFQIAEELFNDKKWVDAILAYDKYREVNPTGKRYAEATYKMGLSFQELGKKADARAFFVEVTQKFPKTDWAKKANQKIKSLK